MGWTSNDYHHEGSLVAVLNDGATTGTSNADGSVVMVYDEDERRD